MAIDPRTGIEAEVHGCTNEECDAHMYRDGLILRCNFCGNTTTFAGWERAQLALQQSDPDRSKEDFDRELVSA